MDDIAEAAVSRAAVSKDQESRRSFLKAVADIRTVCRFADGMKVMQTQDLLHFGNERGLESRFFEHFFSHDMPH